MQPIKVLQPTRVYASLQQKSLKAQGAMGHFHHQGCSLCKEKRFFLAFVSNLGGGNTPGYYAWPKQRICVCPRLDSWYITSLARPKKQNLLHGSEADFSRTLLLFASLKSSLLHLLIICLYIKEVQVKAVILSNISITPDIWVNFLFRPTPSIWLQPHWYHLPKREIPGLYPGHRLSAKREGKKYLTRASWIIFNYPKLQDPVGRKKE